MFRLARILIIPASLILLLSTPSSASPQEGNSPKPSPEMVRLSDLIAGEYTVVETHHPRPGGTEWTATGTASYRPGPDGLSVLERYDSRGPRGAFSAIAVLWWDAAASRFRHFECESGESCAVVEDTGAWDGEAIVFTRQIERQGRRIALEGAGTDFTHPSDIVITTDFSVEGGAKTRTMTIRYTRVRRDS